MSSTSENNKTLVEWIRKSFCITSNAFSMTSPPYSRRNSHLVRLVSAKSVQESFELSPTSSYVTASLKHGSQTETPKASSSRAKEIVAARIGSCSSPPGERDENFNRYDFRNQSEPIRGTSQLCKEQKAQKSDLEIIMESQEDCWFDDDFTCEELPCNLQLIAKPDDQLDMSAFNGLEHLFDKSLVDTPEKAEKSIHETSFNDKDEMLKRRESMGKFIDYLHLCPVPEIDDI